MADTNKALQWLEHAGELLGWNPFSRHSSHSLMERAKDIVQKLDELKKLAKGKVELQRKETELQAEFLTLAREAKRADKSSLPKPDRETLVDLVSQKLSVLRYRLQEQLELAKGNKEAAEKSRQQAEQKKREATKDEASVEVPLFNMFEFLVRQVRRQQQQLLSLGDGDTVDEFDEKIEKLGKLTETNVLSAVTQMEELERSGQKAIVDAQLRLNNLRKAHNLTSQLKQTIQHISSVPGGNFEAMN